MSRGVICPHCSKRGGVVCRKDAFAIFKITEDGGKLIDTEVMDDVDGYHCFKCNEIVDYVDIEDQTDW